MWSLCLWVSPQSGSGFLCHIASVFIVSEKSNFLPSIRTSLSLQITISHYFCFFIHENLKLSTHTNVQIELSWFKTKMHRKYICIYFFIGHFLFFSPLFFIRIYLLNRRDSLWQFQIGLYCILLRSPPPSLPLDLTFPT
jgi:hypothetical protein